MKILFFVLGSIENRILAWGIDGFQSLFEQDIILFGPIPNKKFEYKNKEIPIISFFGQTTINDVFNKLPKNWYPDIVTCNTSIINFIPDIYKCPVKTILFALDAWADTIFNRKVVEFFDFLNYGVIDRSLYNTLKVNILPLSSFAVSIPDTNVKLPEFEKRKIDVITITNYDNAFYHERYKTIYKLSKLNKSGIKIRYIIGLKRPEIHRYYQRSKIVIDWAHTLSNRSYEAALNGCLLFSHEKNKLINDFWTPWEEYVPYNDNNVSELITYYINNPDHAKNIISKAQKKIQAIPASVGQYFWEHIKIVYKTTVCFQERIKRIESTTVTDLYYRLATPLVYNYNYNTNFPSNWKEIYFERIDKALSYPAEKKYQIPPLIEAARMAFLLKKNELSLGYLNELEKILPAYAWIYYLRGRIYFEQNENNQALKSLKKSIDYGLKAPELLQQYLLPIVEKGSTCDGRRITDYILQAVYNHNNEFQVKALLHLAYELTGDIYQRIEEQKEATNAYYKAVTFLPIPNCLYKLNLLLIKSKQFEKLLELTEQGIEDSPYDTILIFYKAYTLIHVKQKCNARKVLKEHQKTLKCFKGNRKILFIRLSINIILLSTFLGKQPGAKIIIEIIKSLKKRIR